MLKKLITFIILVLSIPLYALPETIISDSALYQSPSIQSSILTTLKTGTKVDTQQRSGGWKLIKLKSNQAKSGWVRSYKARKGSIIINKEKTSGGFFSGLASLSRKASGLFSSKKKAYSFQSTATIGIRGLSEEAIKNAKPDLVQLKYLDSYRSSKKVALGFAKQGHLKATSLSHLKKSKAEK